MSNWNEIKPSSLNGNVFELIGKDWMLITAAKKDGSCNTMTASWGGLGVLWNKNVAMAFVRPHRYTFEFMEEAEHFSLSFFPEKYRSALNLCGAKSGRDLNKIEAAGLTLCLRDEVPCFEEAKLTLVVKKLYSDFFHPECIEDPSVLQNYPGRDFHKMFIGEILKVYSKTEQ